MVYELLALDMSTWYYTTTESTRTLFSFFFYIVLPYNKRTFTNESNLNIK